MALKMKYLFLLAALLAGCATAPGPAPEPVPAPAPAPAVAPEPAAKPSSETVAVAGLMQNARTEAAAGRFANSAATIERALRIEPRNPRLWQELARVRLKQGEFAQAESAAARANSGAGSDNTLRAENWRLIAESRGARGDAEGAQKALETAGRIGR